MDVTITRHSRNKLLLITFNDLFREQKKIARLFVSLKSTHFLKEIKILIIYNIHYIYNLQRNIYNLERKPYSVILFVFIYLFILLCSVPLASAQITPQLIIQGKESRRIS